MKEVILIIAVLCVFVYGYFLMVRLDKFLDGNRKAIKKEEEKKEPTCVMLSDEMSDEEISEEVRRFRSKHKGARIVLYDSSETEPTESSEHHVDRKP